MLLLLILLKKKKNNNIFMRFYGTFKSNNRADNHFSKYTYMYKEHVLSEKQILNYL